jgi:phosphoglycolate phosphatase-like HAD superfamily hydrolase
MKSASALVADRSRIPEADGIRPSSQLRNRAKCDYRHSVNFTYENLYDMGDHLLDEIQCVVFDVGETVVDESRLWPNVAERAGIPVFTLCGVLGALIECGEDHHSVWAALGVTRPDIRVAIGQGDLYPDAFECVSAARRAGHTVGIVGNQSAEVEEVLRAAGLEADFIASSAAWGVAKPDPEFFARMIAEAKMPAAAILHVGDRLDNDILPARAVGMRTVHIRRGPWGYIHARQQQSRHADLKVESLSELARILLRGTNT